MSHVHRNGRVCHLNGCDDQTVPIECPACEQPIGHAPKGGMAQASATWDKRKTHLPNCPAHRGGVTMPIATWYCIHPGERTFDPAAGPANRAELEDIRRLDIKPGEVLVATVPPHSHPQDSTRVRELLNELMPGVDVLVMPGFGEDVQVFNPYDLATRQDLPRVR